MEMMKTPAVAAWVTGQFDNPHPRTRFTLRSSPDERWDRCEGRVYAHTCLFPPGTLFTVVGEPSLETCFQCRPVYGPFIDNRRTTA